MSAAYDQARRVGSALTQNSFGKPIVIELFDGERLTLPAGTPKEEILRIAKEQTAYHKQHRGLGENINQFAAGFNRAALALPMKLAEQGAAGLEALYPAAKLKAQLPQSVTNALESGSNAALGFLDHVRGYNLPPVNPAGRFLNKTGEVVGAVMPITGATVMAAPRVAAMTEGSQGIMGGAVNTMARGIAANPAKTAAMETALSVPAGAGAAIANEAYPGNQTAETIGMLLGGFSPMATRALPTRMAGRYLSKPILNATSSAMAEMPERVVSKIPFGSTLARRGNALAAKEARQQVTTEIGGAMDAQAMAGLRQAQELQGVMPGFRPTLAESTGSQSLRATQERIGKQASGSELEQLVHRRAQSEAAISQFSRRAAPEGEGGAEFVVDTGTKRVENLRSGIEQQAARAAEFGETEVAGALPYANKAAIGSDLRSGLAEARRQASADMSQLSDSLGLNKANVSVPFTRFRDEVQAEFSPQSAFEDTKNYPKVVKDILEAPNGVVTFRDIKALRERISDDLIDAMATPSGRTKQVRHLVALKAKVDSLIDSLATSGRFVESGASQVREAVKALRRSTVPKGGKGEDLTSWLVRSGGLREDGGELAAMGINGRARPGLLNKGGKTLDGAAHDAWEAGYFPGKMDRPDVNEFLAALRDDFSGTRKSFQIDDAGVQADAAVRQWDEDLARAGIDWRSMTDAEVDAAILQKFGTAPEGASDLAQRYRQFLDTYRREFVDRFEQGAAFKVRQKDGQGFYRVPDEQVAAAFFSPGDIAGARQFKRVFGNDPTAMDALQSVALDDLRQAAVREGQLVRSQLQTWMRRYATVLDEFPSIKRAVSAYAQAQDALVARQAQLIKRGRTIEDQMMVKAVSKYQSGQTTPEQIISAALSDPRKMIELRNLVKSPEALAALRRHVWDSIADQPAANIEKFLADHAKSLEQLFQHQHLSDLRRIMTARKMIESVPAPQGQGIRTDPLQKVQDTIGMGVPQLGSRLFAVHSGRTSARYVALDAFGRFFRARRMQEVDRLMKEALYNPHVARDMATMAAFPKYPDQAMRKMNVWLFALGFSPISDEQSASARK